jgi:hypothetical protein
VDIAYQDSIIVGKFVEKEKATFLEARDTYLKQKLGDQFIPYEGPSNGH